MSHEVFVMGVGVILIITVVAIAWFFRPRN